MAGLSAEHRVEIGLAQLGIADRGDARDRMVEPGQHEDVGVAGIAGDEEGGDLAAAVAQLLVGRGPAVEDQDHRPRPLALADDVAARADLADVPGGDSADQRAVVVGQPRESAEMKLQRLRQVSVVPPFKRLLTRRFGANLQLCYVLGRSIVRKEDFTGEGAE